MYYGLLIGVRSAPGGIGPTHPLSRRKAEKKKKKKKKNTEGAYELLGDSAPIFQLPGGGVMTEGKLVGSVLRRKSSLTTFNFVKLHRTSRCVFDHTYVG